MAEEPVCLPELRPCVQEPDDRWDIGLEHKAWGRVLGAPTLWMPGARVTPEVVTCGDETQEGRAAVALLTAVT